MFNSLRRRLTLVFLGLAIVPLVLVGTIIEQRSFVGLEGQAVDLQSQVAANVGSEIRLTIEEHERELLFLSEVRGVRTLDREEQQKLLVDMMAYETGFAEIALLDGNGQEQIRLSRTTMVTPEELADRSASEEFVFSSTNNQVYYGPVHIDPVTREPLQTIAMPIIDLMSGKVSYVLVAEFRYKQIWDVLSEIDVPGEGEVYIVDQTGRVIAHQNPSIVFANTTFDLPEEDGQATGLSGGRVVLARQVITFGNQEFVVVAEQPTEQALGLAISNLYLALAVTAITLVAAIVLVILTVRQVVLPVERLSTVANTIREGDLTVRAEVQRDDEIGTLAQAFNDMTQQLQDLIGSLEDRVQARTRDLKVASDVSRQVTTVLELERLLPHLADLTKAGFDLYHVGVFLYDPETGSLRLAAGAGEIGRKLTEQELVFSIEGHTGVIVKAARTREVVVINDTRRTDDFLANPLLPDTQAEIALPMAVGTQLIGVLDLQAAEVGRFTEEDRDVLTTLAEQIAVAVRNAELFTQAEVARAEAEQANTVKSQFLASMSHELRTPLNAILNFTQFVSSGMVGDVNEEQIDILDKVTNSGKHLLSLINDVLDISKIESGALRLFVEGDVDLNKEIQTVIDAGKVLLEDRPVELVEDIQLDMEPIVADKRRVRQIMLNLVSNACKFTEEGQIRVSLHQNGENIVFAVHDTGPGIAPEDHDAIFETFRQTDVGLRQGEGTGLGLPISQRLAEIHGGRLWLESVPGEGASFYVSLPIRSEELLPLVRTKQKRGTKNGK